MRFPMVDSNSAVDLFDPSKPIDEEESERMIHYAIEHGINYFDTAYPYHGGQSETFLGKTLRGDRDKVMIATKLPLWLVEKTDDFDRLLDEQLHRLNTDFVDFYLLHSLNRPAWYRIKEVGALKFMDKILADGRVRNLGFSFHDDVNIFKEIVDGYEWSLCQIQYNYFDENYQAGKEGLEYAAAKGLGVVVMEPLRGGKLTDRIPTEIQKLWDLAESKRTPAEWALRWVWNHAGVSTALSGMSTMDQLIENVKVANDAQPGSLTTKELGLIQKVAETYREMLKVDCTGCAYCMPCPNGVDIPLNFSFYNDVFMFKDGDLNIMLYNHMISPEQQAANCAECGECEEKCPQYIHIIEELKNVHQRLAE
jgi:predicted aldo/keto reductase-like oxidoreductase